MEALLSSAGIFALGTALAGILLFGLAPYLPSALPPSFTRLVGFATVCSATVRIWAFDLERWQIPALLGGAALVIMVVVHLLQTRRRGTAAAAQAPTAPDVTLTEAANQD